MQIFRPIATIAIVFGLLLASRVPDLFAQCGPNEVLVGEDEDNYYCEDKDKIPKPNKPPESNSPDVANWSGNWDKKEKELVRSALSRLKDKKIRDWIAANVRFELRDDPGQQDMISPWAGNATLIFNNYFFSRGSTNARRENLIAFEAGKAFWLNKVVGNRTFNAWFSKYSADHLSLIRRLVNAKHQQEDMSFIYDDPQESSSAFGYVFRAQALGLQLDKTAQNEFEVRIAPFLQGK